MSPVNTSDGKIFEARAYIRHPADIPIEFEVEDVEPRREPLSNISVGGLAFRCDHHIPENTSLIIRVPLVAPQIALRGRVIWSRHDHDHFDIGIQFTDPETEFRIRMIEQICHIEHYKRTIAQNEGREMSGEEAALEWINKYASQFPHTRE